MFSRLVTGLASVFIILVTGLVPGLRLVTGLVYRIWLQDNTKTDWVAAHKAVQTPNYCCVSLVTMASIKAASSAS